MPKLHITSFGCQMNDYDSAKIVKLLEQSHGFTKADTPEQADLLIVNTCSIRDKAQEKLFSLLGRWKKLKVDKPNSLIAVGGCVASQEGANILSRANYVDVIFGPQTLHKLPHLYNESIKQKKPVLDVSFPAIEKFDNLPAPKAEGPTALISIMEGCSKYCSFCIVPYTRGEEISRPFDDVLLEAAKLAEQGVKEINLLGQNVNDYRGKMAKNEYADLALLISYIAAIDGVERIRFTTSHPLAFSDNLIEAYGTIPELANHLHLPVQSGSDRILSLMKRGYTTLEYKNKIKRLKKYRPDIALSTDIIVGFPTETAEDFQRTLDLVDEMQYDISFSFIYSKRPGTPAADIPDHISLEEKKNRLAKLQQKLNHYSQGYSRRLINQTKNILVTGSSKKDSSELTGRTECNRIVNFKGDHKYIGQFVKVKIENYYTNSLKGVLLT